MDAAAPQARSAPIPPVVLGALALVSAGNALYGDALAWELLGGVIVWGACMLILLDRRRLGIALAEVVGRAPGVENGATGGGPLASWPGVVGIGALLFGAAVGGALVPRGVPVPRHLGFLVLLPTCPTLLANWWGARRTLHWRLARSSPDLFGAYGSVALEGLLLRCTLIAAVVVAVTALGDALWGRHESWLAARATSHYALALLILLGAHRGVGDVRRALAQAAEESAQVAFQGSRNWADASDPARDRSWSTGAILEALSLSPGQQVADVGAGAGYFTTRLAEGVGPGGLVLATDAAAGPVAGLRARLSALSQVRVQLVDPTHPLPTAQRLDRILVSNVYLFSEGEAGVGREHLGHFAAALRPGGLLVLYNEFVHAVGWSPGPGWDPLACGQPTASALAEWGRRWFEVAREVALPPAARPFAPHEAPGYLLVLRRQGREAAR